VASTTINGTVNSIDAIINRCPKKPNNIIGTPTFRTLNKLKLDLQDNASSVTSNLGGEHSWYLGLILPVPAYAIQDGAPQPFIAHMFMELYQQ
jgi:hypothetical protein